MKKILTAILAVLVTTVLMAQDPNSTNNYGYPTNFAFAGKTTLLDWHLFDTPTFTADSNHMYVLSRATRITGPFNTVTNCVGLTPVTITNEFSYYKLGQLQGFVIYSTTEQIASGFLGCLGSNYQGYVLWQKPASLGWGWVLVTNDPPFTMTDPVRTDGRIQYFSGYGQNDCGPSPFSFSTVYTLPTNPAPPFQFAEYYPSHTPANTTALWLGGGWITNNYTTNWTLPSMAGVAPTPTPFTPPEWVEIPDVFRKNQPK